MAQKVYTAIGLMSGTSLDGVDAALIETDGESYAKPLGFHYIPYTEEERNVIRPCFGQRDRSASQVKNAEHVLTHKHVQAVKGLQKKIGYAPEQIDLIGFHGQTIFHAPKEGLTIQIGDGELLAEETGIDVAYDFRSNDVAEGGEGAPLAPIYHKALALSKGLGAPLVLLNIGGVANVTWIGEGKEDLIAFDTGPGNALIDDWVQKHTGKRYDEDGKIAASGKPVQSMLEEWLSHPYFSDKPPKSLDRNEWDIAALGPLTEKLNEISIEDGAATLMHFSVEGILKSLEFMPCLPKTWYVAGGGRHNKAMMNHLSHRLAEKNAGVLHSIDMLGWDGDAVEAECFAYLAVRSVLEKPISFPSTTGIHKPLSGGILQKSQTKGQKYA